MIEIWCATSYVQYMINLMTSWGARGGWGVADSGAFPFKVKCCGKNIGIKKLTWLFDWSKSVEINIIKHYINGYLEIQHAYMSVTTWIRRCLNWKVRTFTKKGGPVNKSIALSLKNYRIHFFYLCFGLYCASTISL